MKYLFAFSIALLLSLPVVADSRCEQYEKNAKHFSDFRRKGGSAKDMDQWKREMRYWRAKYRECLNRDS